MKVIVKGGVWKNTEDEILKAAVSKYGKNQWARISSLLVRKTPKQCKARWYEWLDPSIKKTDWSREEDEKLLHLAKLMPTQWRTIAPIVGRTANQCLERYQRLLDQAEAQDGLGLTGSGEEAAPTAEDVRKLRPGEIDPDPETKPAQPDPIDMDDEEKEMLSEARARLANTQGKKAKRKARERALDDARRLAVLQKRREMRAAGIFTRVKKRVVGMDLNAEIPFEKQPAPGFFDTAEEAARTYDPPVRRNIRELKRQKRADEEEARKKREAAQTPKDRTDIIRRLREVETVTKRRRLELPEAQVSDAELEQIAKLGYAGQAARELVADDAAASESLLGDYAALERVQRTPRATHDTIMADVRELRERTETQTPLLGGDVTPGATPLRGSATPMHGPGDTPLHGGVTPTPMRAGMTPTPLRDSLGLNNDMATPRYERAARAEAARALRAGLSSLPAPKNDFDVVLDGELPEEAPQQHIVAEDAAARDARLRKEAEEIAAREFAHRSQAVQRGLPRPAHVDVEKLRRQLDALDAHDADAPRRLVNAEYVRLVAHDAAVFPLPGARVTSGGALAPIDDALLEAARAAVNRELACSLGISGAKTDEIAEALSSAIDVEEIDQAAKLVRAEMAYDARGVRVPRAALSDEEFVAGAAARLEKERAQLQELAVTATKGERTLGKLLGGYQARSKMLATRIRDNASALGDKERTLRAFERLAVGENGAASDRLARLEEEVQRLATTEDLAQREYAELSAVRADLTEAVEALETEIAMRHAEAALA
ncbi:Pre-mRNA-splicing factor cef1 [Malassezia cuniculi]|uniref:Pre-mRNA-splicing factor CEF1 n=1 Tax=Malassezia cuniculi TaxID=948313 RepID=A0AAF0J6T5_9BASI|nr:Pre-mRNA-splicing factor cef1 [Malassezia cuniculi]